MSTNKDTGHHSEYVPLEDQKIINVEINKEMRKSFLDYSMAVNSAAAATRFRAVCTASVHR